MTYAGNAIGRILARISVDANGCWLWPGSKVRGYGRIRHYTKVTLTHRVTFEFFVGPIPDGLQIDHLCRVPACCNPDHLEPVTQLENYRRGLGSRRRTDPAPFDLWCPACGDGPFNPRGVSRHRPECGKTAAPSCDKPSAGRYVRGCRCRGCRRLSRERTQRYRRRSAA